MIYLTGDMARLSINWSKISGQPINNPDTQTLEISSAALATPVVITGNAIQSLPGAGGYYYDYLIPAEGTYHVVWSGTEAGKSDVVSYQFDARDEYETGDPDPYVSLTEFREHLKSDPGDPAEALSSWELLDLLYAASTMLDADTGRTFGSGEEGEVRYYGSSDGTWLVVDDLTAISEVAVDLDGSAAYATILTPAHYLAERAPGKPPTWPYEQIRLLPTAPISAWPMVPNSVRVTGTYGWAKTGSGRELVKTAVKLKAARWYARKDAPLGVQIVYDGNGTPNSLSLRADGDYNDIVKILCRTGGMAGGSATGVYGPAGGPVVSQPQPLPAQMSNFRLGRSKYHRYGPLGWPY